MIPLKKLIEYKGNRYEITKAMIELARNGKDLLRAEVKHKKEKYIPIVIGSILDGKIKFDYTDGDMQVDEYAPYKASEEVYDETIYIEEENDHINVVEKDSDDDDYDDDDDD